MRKILCSLCLVVATGCSDGGPEAIADVAGARLSILAPTSSYAVDVGSAPTCPAVAGGLELPLDADVTLAAEFLDADGGEIEVNSRYRLSGDGSDEPAVTGTSVSFSREDAFSATLTGTTEGTGSITLSLFDTRTSAPVWGPCEIPLIVVAPETAPMPWGAVAESPESPGEHFQDGSFLSPQQGWVIGGPGVVYYTDDGGANWEKRFDAGPTASDRFYRAVAFVSETKGWIGDLNRFNNPVAGRALWETSDGGFTWTNISSRITGPAVTGICGMWVVNASTVVGVGRWNGPAFFVKTQDAGTTWQSVALAPLITGAVDVFFFDEQNGLIAGARGDGNTAAEQNSSRVVILSTNDGGATWTERFVGSVQGARSWKISFPTPMIGYVATQGASSGPVILKTTDGGASWREITIGASSEFGFWGIGFTSARSGWVSSSEDGVWETRDGGLTWTQMPWGLDQSINRFRMFPDGSAFGMGHQVHRLAP